MPSVASASQNTREEGKPEEKLQRAVSTRPKAKLVYVDQRDPVVIIADKQR